MANRTDTLAELQQTLRRAMQLVSVLLNETADDDPTLKGKAKHPSRMLTLIEAAEYLGYSPHHLRSIVARSKRRKSQGKPDPDGVKFAQGSTHAKIRFDQLWLDEHLERVSVDPTEARQPIPAKQRKAKGKPSALSEIKPYW